VKGVEVKSVLHDPFNALAVKGQVDVTFILTFA
jgi:hypothetical protein